MSSTVSAVRAVSSEYAKQLLLPVLLIAVGIYVLLMAIIIWIAVAVSPWWLLLAFFPTLLFCVGLAVWIGVRVAAGRLAPAMNKRQKAATKKVVKLLGEATERLGTPWFILIFRVVRDVMFPPQNNQTLIGELADTPGQLHRSFDELRKLF